MVAERVEICELCHGTVHLVPYDSVHMAKTVEWLQQSDLRRTFGLTVPVTLASHKEWLADQKDLYLWAIHSGASEYVGNTSLRVNSRHRNGLFELYLGKASARGRGVGKSVLQAVLRFAFETLELHRVCLYTLLDNAAAERLYRRQGFREEGLLRECLLRDGEFVNQKVWSLLATEWAAANQ